MSLRFRLYLSLLAGLLASPDVARCDPISVIVLAAIGTSTATALAIAVTTFVLTAVATFALTLITNALFGPKNREQERQASVLQLSIGEVAREAGFGKYATGGSLNDAGNYGGTYGTDWELLIITTADHKCASLEGFYVNDSYVAFSGDGAVAGYNGQLEVYWRDGSASQTLPSIVTNIGWSSTEDVGGSALIVVAYKADAPDQATTVFNSRPSFLWVVRGKLCYDPRKDSTVGGSGAHRWATPSTWEWTDNLSVCRYNWVRGIYAKDQVTNPAMLLVGRGLSSIEAPESNVFAYANLCDENVPLAAGGSVKRYTFNGVIRADEKYVDVERKFAECCAGVIVQPNGAVEVEPGQAKSITATITDDDLVSGEDVQWSPFRSEADSAWVNTVVASYAEPTQKYQDHAAPVRRYTPDLTADGGPREQRLSLSGGVTVLNQTSRVAEIVRRLGRFVGSASITLPPRFAGITEGDWIQWTNARRFGGLTKTFRVEACSLDEKWRNRLSLREIGPDCFTWTTADETASTAVAVPQTPPPGGWIKGYDKVDFATQVYGGTKPDNNATRNVQTGVWSSATTYSKGDMARTASGDATYIAKSTVPAGTLQTNTAYWDLLVQGSGGSAGANAFQAFLTNPVIVVTTAADGSGGSYSGATGTMKLYEGPVDRTASSTFAVVGSVSWALINSSGVYSVTDSGADQASVQFDVSYASVTYRLTLNVAKSKTGVAGANAKTLYVSSTFQTITYDAAGALSPSSQTNTFDAVKQNTTGTVAWTITDNKGNALTPATFLSATTGNSVTMTAANFSAALAVSGATGLTVIGTIAADSLSDKISVAKVQAGAAGTNGTNGSNGATGNKTVRVYKRAGSAPSAPTGNLTPSGWSLTIPTDDGTAVWASDAEISGADGTTLVGSWTTPVQFQAATPVASVQTIFITDQVDTTAAIKRSLPNGGSIAVECRFRSATTAGSGTQLLRVESRVAGGTFATLGTQVSNAYSPGEVISLNVTDATLTNSSGNPQAYEIRAVASLSSGGGESIVPARCFITA